MYCQKQKVNRPESYVGVLELRLLFFLNFNEERGFLRVDWDCFLTFGDFVIFYHVVHNGSWSCVLSWATCRFVTPRDSGQELRSALRPGARERLSLVESCQYLCKGIELLAVRDTATDFCPLTCTEPGGGHWGWGRGQFVLDMNWILTLVCLSKETA